MSPDPASAAEQTEKDELLFALHHRDKPTLAFVECNSTAKRDELEAWLPTALPEYGFVTLDLTPLTVGSLLRTLTEQLPAEVRESPPVRYVVNVHGLENRLDETLAAQLNLERELLFRNVPYIIVVWADSYFFRRLQRLAPDLWHWVTYKFRFNDPTAQAVEKLPPLPPERLPQRGDITARRERIRELEERYSHLDLSNSNKLRLLREKFDAKCLLALEYTEAFEYKKSALAYREALGLNEQLKTALNSSINQSQSRGSILYNLGYVYIRLGLFDESLDAYLESRALLTENFYARIDHQLGIAYAAQERWANALSSYESSVYWRQQTNDLKEIGSTFHQIGALYAAQKRWALSLENYENAVKLKKEAELFHALGVTYHQIGRLYEEQGQWKLSLENYNQAIEWNERTGNNFDQAVTYHQIGVIHAKQGQWESALINCMTSLEWRQRTGNLAEVSNTYNFLGWLHERQVQLAEALVWYERALASAASSQNMLIAQEALARVRAALGHPPAA